MALKEFVFVVYDNTEDGDIKIIEAYSSNDNAKAAAKNLKSGGSSNVEVKKLELKSEVDATAAKKGKAKTTTDAKALKGNGKKAKSPEKVVEDEDDEDGEDDDEPTTTKPKKAASKKTDTAKTTIPEGKPNALKGLKILFTGTMSMDRKTCEAAAKKYGAQVINKLEETDYIILGTRPGDKKVKEINEKSLETISEAEFFELLKNGVPQEKRDRMAAAAEAAAAAAEDGEPVTKKQKK